MPYKKLLLSTISLCMYVCAFAQIKVPACPLDSADFQKSYQWRMWQRDTTLTENVSNYLNYFVALQRNFLPSNFELRKAVRAKLNKQEIADLKTLDSLYLFDLSVKRSYYLGETPGFNKNLPAFTYLNFIMVFEVFKHYPDVQALQNMADFRSSKRQTKNEFREKLNAVMVDMEEETDGRRWAKYRLQFQAFQNSMTNFKKEEGIVEMWQNTGLLTEKERFNYNWINFLIWCTRDY